MELAEVLTELAKCGTAQNRKVYAKHGVKEPLFGVSYAHQGRLRKAIKTDHALALQLWESENHDARILATMIADPAAATVGLLNGWVHALDNYVLSDAVAAYAARTPLAKGRRERWTPAAAKKPAAPKKRPTTSKRSRSRRPSR